MELIVKVTGVTFEGRQEVIAILCGNEPCRIVPQPDNPYDSNALAVEVALEPGLIQQIGFVPRQLAASIAPYLDGESIMVSIKEIIGGFELFDGERANYGVLLSVVLPEAAHD